MPAVRIYDTTLRDGTQGEDVAFSAEDKLRIARKLDELGVHYIEGGFPGSNPKDTAFFREIRSVRLSRARIVAFGSTCRAGVRPEDDRSLASLVEAGTDAVAVFGKSWDIHPL
jgi:2-isopropylmalate synthase